MPRIEHGAIGCNARTPSIVLCSPSETMFDSSRLFSFSELVHQEGIYEEPESLWNSDAAPPEHHRLEG